jgi:hypothetical protein
MVPTHSSGHYLLVEDVYLSSGVPGGGRGHHLPVEGVYLSAGAGVAGCQ